MLHFQHTGNLVARSGVQLTSEIQGSTVSWRAYNWTREWAMKLRFLALTAALLTFSFAAPWTLSQDQGTPSPSASGTAAQTEQTDKSPQTDKTTPVTPTVTPADPDKVKHDGGKNDVDAIGNRKMGGRGMGNWYSIEGEIRMGKQYAQMVEASSKMVTDPVVTEYVNRIGQNLVRNSDAQVPFTIKVIDSDEIN